MKQGTVMITVLVVAVIAIAAAFVLIGNGDDEKDDLLHPKIRVYGYSATRTWMIVSMKTI